MESAPCSIMDDWFKSRVIVAPSGCWIWQRATLNSGYGKLRANGQWWSAHRYVYTRFVGPIPTFDVIRHKCRTKLCVNPEHLCTGSYQDNLFDQIEHGTFKPPHGELRSIEYYREIAARNK